MSPEPLTDLVLLSGGLDSATLLAARAASGSAALALGIDYGQRHRRELAAAASLAAHYRVPFEVLDLSAWGRLLGGSALTDPAVAVPVGADQAPTVVPNRNATMLSAAVGIAQARGLQWVLTATHADDHATYPDCRPDFLLALEQVVDYATEGAVAVAAPFTHLPKVAVVRLAVGLGVPIGATWSCYVGGPLHCGTCGACTGRRAALAAAGVADPTDYLAEAAALMFAITKEFTFSASHQLAGLPAGHRCGRIHGHNYRVRLQLSAADLDDRGMVVDYTDLHPFGEWIDTHLDHQHLNDRLPDGVNPTAERLADILGAVALQQLELPAGVKVAVGVSETPKTWAWWTP